MMRNIVSGVKLPIVKSSSVFIPCKDGSEVRRRTNIAMRPPIPPTTNPQRNPASTPADKRLAGARKPAATSVSSGTPCIGP